MLNRRNDGVKLPSVSRTPQFECLELRQLLAADLLYEGTSHKPSLGTTAASITNISVMDTFGKAPNLDLDFLDKEFLETVDSLIAGSRPGREKIGKNTPTTLNAINSLKENVLASPKPEAFKFASVFEPIDIVVAENSENNANIERLEESLHRAIHNTDSPTVLPATSIYIGGYCTEDGTIVLMQEGYSESEAVILEHPIGHRPTSLSGEGEDEDEDDDWIVPVLDFPSLESLSIETNFVEYSPATSSFTTLTFEGSFTEASLTNPDMAATGLNWVHKISNQWIDSSNWSFSEQFVAVYDLETSVNEFEEIEDWSFLGDEPTNPEETPPEIIFAPSVEGSWEADTNVSRYGYLIYTFTVSRGLGGPAVEGNAWSFSVSYSDTINASMTSEMGISYNALEQDPIEPSLEPPEELEVNDQLATTFSSSIRQAGDFSLVMLPALNAANHIEYLFSGHSTSETEYSDTLQVSSSSGAQSGDLFFPASPANPEQNPLINCTPVSGPDPFGVIFGYGTAYLTSESLSNSLVSNSSGTLSFSGKLVDGQLTELDAAGSSLSGNEVDEDYNFQDSIVVKLTGQFPSSMGEVDYDLLVTGFSLGAMGTTGEADDDGDSSFAIDLANQVSMDTDGTTNSDGSSTDSSTTVFNISATYFTPRTWAIENEPFTYGVGTIVYDNGEALESSSFDLALESTGQGVGVIQSVIAGNLPPTTVDESEMNGNSTWILTMESASSYVNESYYEAGGSYPHARLSDLEWTTEESTVITITTEVQGTFRNELLADGSVDWSVNGTHTSEITVEYLYSEVKAHSILHTDSSGPVLYSELANRIATLNGSKQTVTELDAYGNSGTNTTPETATLDTNATTTYLGDEFVTITNTWIGDDVMFNPYHQWSELTQFETTLQGLLSRETEEEPYGRAYSEVQSVDSFFALFAEGEGNTPSQRRLTAGAMAAELGLYSTDRHRDAYRGATEMQSLFANATPGVGAVLGVHDAIAGEDSITQQPLSWWQRGLGTLGAVPFLGALGSAADTAASASRASKAVSAVDKVASVAPVKGLAKAMDDLGLPNSTFKFAGAQRIDSLRSATHADIVNAFKETGLTPTGHFITRIKDARLEGLGIYSFKDLENALRYGERVFQDKTVVLVSGRIGIVIDPIRKTLVTVTPW